MNRGIRTPRHVLAKDEGARALISATHDFLRANNVSKDVFRTPSRRGRINNLRMYRKMTRAYRDVAVLIATWFTNPKFMDKSGQPIALTVATGPHSVANLIRHSRVRVPRYLALEMMTCSPSVSLNADGTLTALRRVLVLPEFEVPRAALVVERYLDTLRRNASGRRKKTVLLLERNCFVSDVDLTTISPTLRDIKEKGTAFMDAVDGEIESCRPRRVKGKVSGELGVVVFAWTRPNKGGMRQIGP
jgi:hypothetical protein